MMIMLTKIRKSQNKSQRELMRETGIDVSYINRAERLGGRMYPNHMDKIAKALNWDGNPVDLFKEVEDDSNN